MAKAISQSGGYKGRKPLVTSGKPKKLSKAGEWMRTHPEGILEIVNMRAVMR